MHEILTSQTKESSPIVLVMGSTGKNGKLILEELQNTGQEQVRVRVSSHKQEQVEKFKAEGLNAVLLNLDDPNTYEAALVGVERLFLLTGYTVDMLAQSKIIVDTAKKVGVKHIIHLGVFAPSHTTIRVPDSIRLHPARIPFPV
ncbi:NmrA family protein [Calothrix sp. NIES-4071]|nr:NmrA family protein [Calothrix sp. NIES-4071]BAZ57880.1 NmrA family protein [Calothrix sp. NIES-4105]